MKRHKKAACAALLLVLAAAPAQALDVQDAELRFTLKLPDGFVDLPGPTRENPNVIHAWKRRFADGPGALVVEVLRLHGTVGHEPRWNITKDANPHFFTAGWNGFEINACRSHGARANVVLRSYLIPLKDEAIQLRITALESREAEAEALEKTVLASLEGESSWLTSRERAYQIGGEIGEVIGFGLVGAIGAYGFRLRRRKSRARADTDGSAVARRMLFLVPILAALAAAPARALEVVDTEPHFKLKLPDGFREIPELMQGEPHLVHVWERPFPGESDGILVLLCRSHMTIERERAADPRERWTRLPAGESPIFFTARWQGLDIDACRIEGKTDVCDHYAIPLREEAILLKIIAPAAHEADARALAPVILASLEGESNWTAPSKRRAELERAIALFACTIVGGTAAIVQVLRRRAAARPT